jgi:8-amino-7-oxononanoate synthase
MNLSLCVTLLVHTGYATNPVLAQALAGDVTQAYLDARAHASLREAADLLACPVHVFAHRDVDDLKRRLRRLPLRARPLVLTDGVFSHDGSIAPLGAMLDALPPGGRLLVDEAHAAGVLGAGGRGTAEECAVSDPRLIRSATLSKAFGACGGVVLGGRAVLARIIARSRWFAASTPMPLPAAAAALAAGRLISGDAALRARLRANTARVKTAAREAGFVVPDTRAPMLGLAPAGPAMARRWRQTFLGQGVFPSLIQYPGGPSAGFLRLAFSSEHADTDLTQLTQAIEQLAARGSRPG